MELPLIKIFPDEVEGLLMWDFDKYNFVSVLDLSEYTGEGATNSLPS